MALIFQPVAVVGMMGIGLILVIEVSGILATCSDTSDTDTFNTTLNNAGNVATI
ncbi:MAG: hypothetical protein Q8O99_02225 [bacterium]|nr:hypothetical protein [bacterium]